MKVNAILAAGFVAFGAATPVPKVCTPGTYLCTPDTKGWQVYNINRSWLFAGVGPPKTGCLFNKQNGSPY
ncbi:hypothetical protein FAVG1_08605 [Fusarium avenaceum]|nr:hypothetical protein FAVG1_08605 [Fusarium avenaceum]